MAEFREALGNAAKSAVCEALRSSERFGDALVYAWQNVTGLNISPPNLAGAAMGLLCNEPRVPLPANPDYLGGGQCQCVPYIVSYGLKRRGGQSDLRGDETFWGEIRGVRFRTNSLGNTGIEILCRGSHRFGEPCGEFKWVASGAGTSAGDIINYEIYSIRRLDGASDNCATPTFDEPEPIEPTSPVTINAPFYYQPDINFPDVNISTNASFNLFQPFLNVKAEINVPVTVNTGIDLGGVELKFEANVNINTGNVSFNFGGNTTNNFFGSENECDDGFDFTDDPPEIPTDVPEPEPDPEEEEKRIIVGVLVTVLSVDPTTKASQIAQGSNPTIYAPSLGHVNFYCEVGEASIGGWTSDVQVKNKRNLILCPWEEGATAVEGTPQPGVSWILTPIYRKIKSQKAVKR